MSSSAGVYSDVLWFRCFEVASVGWMTRQIAQAIFATPPKSSFDEVTNSRACNAIEVACYW